MEAGDKRRNEDTFRAPIHELSSPSHKSLLPLPNPPPSHVENPSTRLAASDSHAQDNIPTASISLRTISPILIATATASTHGAAKSSDLTVHSLKKASRTHALLKNSDNTVGKIAPKPPASASDQRTRDQIVSATEKLTWRTRRKTHRAKPRSEHNPFSTMAPYIPPHLRPEFLKRIKNLPPETCEKPAVVNNPAEFNGEDVTSKDNKHAVLNGLEDVANKDNNHAVLDDLEDVTNKNNNPPVPGPDGSKSAT